MLRENMVGNSDATMLIWRQSSDGRLLGCVWLEPDGGEGSWYLGSLTIDRDEQNKELGRKLLAAAEDWVAGQGGRMVKMTVVNVRVTSLAWYARRGYTPTHETKPFPYDDKRFGIPRRDDL